MGDMLDYIQLVGKTRLRFLVPTRCLIGYRSEFTTQTRGTGVLNHVFYAYEPFKVSSLFSNLISTPGHY